MSRSFYLVSGLLLKSSFKRKFPSRTVNIVKKIGLTRLFVGSSLFRATINSTRSFVPIDKKKRPQLDFEDEIRRATEEGEKYLAHMIRMLRTLILQTSLEYQECLINQIELTKTNTKTGPVGAHWDKLTSFRVQGKELKEELNRYQVLATSIADIINRQVSSSLVQTGNDINLKQLNVEMMKLQRLCKEQLQEIFKYEAELLLANRDSILHGYKRDV